MNKTVVVLMLFSILTVFNAALASAKEVVIISSNTKTLPAGSKLATKSKIHLEKGEVVRLMTMGGEIYKFDGPLWGEVEPLMSDYKKPNVTMFEEVVNVMYRAGQPRGAIGASRGKSGKVAVFKPGVVDVTWGIPEIICLYPGQSLVLVSPPVNAKKVNFRVSRENHESEVKGDKISVPAHILKSKPRRIRVNSNEGPRVFSITLRYANAVPTPGEQMQWYRNAACKTQLNQVIRYYQTF